MKKLMVALAAVALTGAVSAADFQWKVASYNGVTGGEGQDAYIIFGNNFDQTAFLTTLVDGGTFASIVADYKLDNFTLDEWGEHSSLQKFSTDKVDSKGAGGVPTVLNAYLAVLASNGNVYLSEIKPTAAQPSTAPTITFSEGATSANPATTFAKGDTFSGAGWYTTVPEPTSGLLLLLGVAGLALRRRRA